MLRLASLVLFAAALYVAFAVAPPSTGQGEVYRIAFVHVPAAWLSLLIYAAMAACAALGLFGEVRGAAVAAQALAPTGALFTFLALWTGAIWGKPTWGTWWAWDARLTSELVLLLLYLGVIALDAAIADPRRRERACALLALVGSVDLPIVLFSSGPVGTGSAPAPASIMLIGMALTAVAFGLHAAAMALARTRCVVLERQAAP